MSKFYVYTLSDPRNGEVFYVGKGSGRRILDHEAEARRGKHTAKCDRIRAIWDSGLFVEREISARFDCENEALAYEARLIEAIGLDVLTNVMPGGVLGTDAYMARQRELEARAKLLSARVWNDAFEEMAPKLAKALRIIMETGGFGVMVRGKWIEMSDAVILMVRSMIAEIGFDQVYVGMRRHGVEIS